MTTALPAFPSQERDAGFQLHLQLNWLDSQVEPKTVFTMNWKTTCSLLSPRSSQMWFRAEICEPEPSQ